MYKNLSTLVLFIILPILFLFSSSKNIYANNLSWDNELDLLEPLANTFSYSEGNTVFVFAGSTTYVSNKIHSSILDTNGHIENWEYLSENLPKSLFWHSGAKYSNYIYVLGGNEYPPIASVNTVYKGEINGGKIVNWDLQPNFNIPIADGAAFIKNQNIYYSGGGEWSGGSLNIKSEILKANINFSGNLSGWTLSGLLPFPLLGHQVIDTGSKLYLLGGYRADLGQTTDEIREAIFDANGNITWSEPLALRLPNSVYHFMTTITDGKLFVIGGRGPYLDAPYTYNNVKSVDIINGELGSTWTDWPSFPMNNCCAGISSTDTHIYVMGGHNGAAYFNSVWSLRIKDSTPTPTPTSIPTPTITNPLIFLPGMGGSWNSAALIHNIPTDNSLWESTPTDQTYDGLITSLTDLGYEKDKSLFLYYYDWRKDVRINALALTQFIDNVVLAGKPVGSKVDLLGYSMGGLVAWAAVNQTSDNKINKVITAGTPFSGSALIYHPWEGADFSNTSDLQSLLLRLFLWINSGSDDNKVETLQRIFPSGQNLIPIWEYLLNCKTAPIKYSDYFWKNNIYDSLKSNFEIFLPKLTSLSGSGYPTLNLIKTTPRSFTDKNEGKWKDGKPTGSISADGDGTVTSQSSTIAGAGQKYTIPGYNHGQLVSDTLGQIQILRTLGFNQETLPIHPSSVQKYQKNIIAAIASPATFKITINGQDYYSQNDLLIISNPPDGNYQVTINGTGSGPFTFYFGRVLPNDEAWETFSGNFLIPGSKIVKNYKVSFNDPNLGANPIENIFILIDEMLIRLKNKPKAVASVLALKKIIQPIPKLSGINLKIQIEVTNKYINTIIPGFFSVGDNQTVSDLRRIKIYLGQYAGDKKIINLF